MEEFEDPKFLKGTGDEHELTGLGPKDAGDILKRLEEVLAEGTPQADAILEEEEGVGQVTSLKDLQRRLKYTEGIAVIDNDEPAVGEPDGSETDPNDYERARQALLDTLSPEGTDRNPES